MTFNQALQRYKELFREPLTEVDTPSHTHVHVHGNYSHFKEPLRTFPDFPAFDFFEDLTCNQAIKFYDKMTNMYLVWKENKKRYTNSCCVLNMKNAKHI